MNPILIVDYGMGNLQSVRKKLIRLKATPIVSSDPEDVINADKIILPGVGNFQKAMGNLERLHLTEALNEAVQVRHAPILGICLGLQLMATKSEEGGAEGLGWIDADVIRFRVRDKLKYKVPHTGWNQITKTKQSDLLKGISDSSEFYFVHSYHLRVSNSLDVLTQTEYEYDFPSSIHVGNIFGVQYHPEKSHDVGELLLDNFVRL